MKRALLCFLLAAIGCQPATHYEKPAADAAAPPPAVVPPAPKPADDPTLAWVDPNPAKALPDVPLVFVCASDGDEWARLPRFWNPPPTDAEKTAAALALGPLTAAAPLADTPAVVKVRVPPGLDDPRPFIPASDPPTLAKWELGRRLFYDRAVLGGDRGESCASCHQPQAGFADNTVSHYGVNTPTLINCVFNRRQFWDGRVAELEEVVQRTPADETAPTKEPPPFRHLWGGAVRRLRTSEQYTQLFRNAFGAPPTQDAVGKALATYMRTLLADDSLHDRAVRAQAAEHAPTLAAAHYEKALDDAALKTLGLEGKPKAEAARRVYTGYRLFHDLEEHKTGCIRCHNTREFTDGQFHNLGVGWKGPEPGQEPGRFASLPPGLKDRSQVGAYKTPTLRGLLRTAPYFHDGSAATLEAAVTFHLNGGLRNDYLDEAIREPRNDVTSQEMADLVLFLRALDGEEVDPAVLPPPPR